LQTLGLIRINGKKKCPPLYRDIGTPKSQKTGTTLAPSTGLAGPPKEGIQRGTHATPRGGAGGAPGQYMKKPFEKNFPLFATANTVLLSPHFPIKLLREGKDKITTPLNQKYRESHKNKNTNSQKN